MIMSFEKEDEFSTESSSPRFDVATPSSNPLVANLCVVVTKNSESVEVSVGAEASDSGLHSVIDEVSRRAKRDADRFPRNARAHANFGAALAKAGRFDEAITELEVALELQPDDYLAGVTMARVYVSKAEYEKARTLYQGLLILYPRSDSVLLSLAFLSLRTGDYASAEEYLEKVKKVNKGGAFPFFLLGIARLKSCNFHGAISALKNATRLDVRRSEFHQALGAAYSISGDPHRAERSFRSALALSPDRIAVVHALGSVLIEQGEKIEALGLLRPFVESFPNDVSGQELLAQAYFAIRKFGLARTHFLLGLEAGDTTLSAENKARFLTNIAASFLNEGKNRLAEVQLDRAIKLAPRWAPTPYEHLARIRIRAKEWQFAIDVLEYAKTLFGDQQSPRRLLAGLYAMQDSYDLAIAELLPLYEEGTADADTRSLLGALYEEIGDYETALRMLVDAHAQSPRSLGIINNLAYVYLMSGQPAPARKLIGSVPKSVQVHPELIATQGLLRLWEGDRIQGKALYEEAVKLASTGQNRDFARLIRQKMYLELAKDSIRRRDFATARAEIAKGLSVRLDGRSFKVKLGKLTADANAELI